MLRFLLLSLGFSLSAPAWSDGAHGKSPCAKIVAGLISPVLDEVRFLRRVAEAHGGLVEELLDDGGSEAEIFLVGRAQNGTPNLWIEKRFRIERLARLNFDALERMRKFEAEGLLGPFSVVKTLGLEGKVLRLEYVPGQTIMSLGTSLYSEGLSPLLERFNSGLKDVRANLERRGLKVLRQTFPSSGRSLDAIYVSDLADFDSLSAVFAGGTPPLFSIVDANVVVHYRTGRMVVIDPF